MRKDQLGRGFVGVLTATFLLQQLPCHIDERVDRDCSAQRVR